MSTEKAQAIVVRGSDWSETSRIVTLFTREFGKVRAVAKGARRQRSNFEFALDLLSVCHVVFIHKAQGGLDLLTEAQRIQHFPQLRQNLQLLNIGYYVAELLSDGTQDYDPHPMLFDVALDLLKQTEAHPLRVGSFELAWLRELGYSPRLDTCSRCDCTVVLSKEQEARIGFSLSTGGVLCLDCLPQTRDRQWLSVKGWQSLRSLSLGLLNEVEAMPHAEVRRFLGQFVSSVLGRRPRLLPEMDKLA